MNNENLKPQNKRTKREQREIAQMGGKASGAARRRKKTMRTLAKELLALPVAGNEENLKKLEIAKDDMSNAMLMLVSMFQEALDGNVKAAEFLRDMAGESPSLDIRKKELSLRKSELELKKDVVKSAGTDVEASIGMLQLVDSLNRAHQDREGRDD